MTTRSSFLDIGGASGRAGLATIREGRVTISERI